ncbi:abortive infection family protein [Priestia megaterium]|uniref:abortive infection family protein n=1 Tax=Priestia megaterium TaxID=1404 RepID=UPI003B9F2416
MFQEILQDIEVLKNVLTSRATGEYSDAEEYKQLRHKLINNTYIKGKLPRFVLTCRSLDEFWGYIKEIAPTYQGRRSYLREEFNELLIDLEQKAYSSSPIDEIISTTISADNSYSYIQESWQKALDRRISDPEGAITMARTLLETTCKHIMDQANEKYDEKADLPQLYKGVQRILNLAPSNHTEDIFKQILGGCVSIVNGLGSVRNKLSDAHGKSIKGPKPSTRHAQMAVNMGGAMAEFLISSWLEKSKS